METSYEDLLNLVNENLFNMPIFVSIGLIYIAILEWRTIKDLIKDSKKINKSNFLDKFRPISNRLFYLILGILVAIIGLVVISYLTEMYVGFRTPPVSETAGEVVTLAGVLAVIGFELAGIILVLSAGGRWMVNLAKLIVTLVMLSLFTILVSKAGHWL